MGSVAWLRHVKGPLHKRGIRLILGMLSLFSEVFGMPNMQTAIEEAFELWIKTKKV